VCFSSLLACTPIDVQLEAPIPRRGSGELLVGAMKTDITPMPGYPMGGHAIGGRYGFGAMGPLLARALYLEDPDGTPLVLVAMDVWGVSPGLRDRVVEHLQQSHGLTHIAPSHVVLSASHTHHSSAAFATDLSLNLGAGLSPSFSRVLFERYAARIAQAIADAHDLRRPSTLLHGAEPVFNYARNRSLPAFLDNPEASKIVDDHPFPPTCTLPNLPDGQAPVLPSSCQAVDPRVRLLKFVDARDGTLIAGAVFANAHNTAMPNTTEFYHADFFGLAANRVESKCEDACVIGIFNGAEGDVSTTWRVQSLDAMHRAAATLEDAIDGLLIDAEPATLSSGFDIRAGWFALNAASYIDAAGHQHKTANKHALGRSVLGGAEDGIVERNARRRRYGEGVKRDSPSSDGHGTKKKTLLRSPERWLDPAAPVQLINIGGPTGFTLVSLPGEVTTVVGLRIKEAVASLGPSGDRILLMGLSNAYKGYFTTHQEYAHQEYEGGQTWWGEAQAGVLADRIGCLAREHHAEHCDGSTDAPTRRYRPGAVIEHGLHSRRLDPVMLTRAQQSTRALTERDAEGTPRANVTWTFERPPPAWSVDDGAETPVPRVHLEQQVGPCMWEPLMTDGYPESDTFARVVTLVTEIERRAWSWETRWIFADQAPDDATLRFRSDGQDASTSCSAPFSSDALTSSTLASASCTCASRDKVRP